MPTALITCATSGIGYQFARRLAEDGHDLILVARTREALEKVATELEQEFGVTCTVLRADLGRLTDCRRVENVLTDQPIDLLVNNAGFGLYEGDFIEHDLEAEDQLLMVNVRAILRLTYAALGPMVERGEGAIINVSSVASFAPDAKAPTYAASKAWVTSFTQGVREQIAGSGVRMLALTPGLVPTEFQEKAGVEANVPSPFWLDPAQVVDTALKDLAAGHGVSVPGLAYRAIRVAMQMTPRRLYLPLSGALMQRFTA
jgi:short-subunit dehydrogenase